MIFDASSIVFLLKSCTLTHYIAESHAFKYIQLESHESVAVQFQSVITPTDKIQAPSAIRKSDIKAEKRREKIWLSSLVVS